MAIDASIPHADTDDLAQTEKGFYQMKIPVSYVPRLGRTRRDAIMTADIEVDRHWQLRHYISTPEQDHLYYASAHDIFCLNTVTKKRKHIATLPFEARCTASGFGYVCVGGEEDGHFATIKLAGTLDVDSALPIEGWRPQQSGLTLGRRAPTVKVERIGEEIVNSISIHRIQDEEAHLDDIVAVLTNNDKTVRIYSLPLGQETRVKDLPFAINHATISPDGTMMVAVGDYNQAYFFTREIVDTPPQIPKPHNRLTSASVDWRLTNVVKLHVSNPDATVGYFTSAWSPSGTLVAVGSEGGYITVIDADMLADPDYDDDEAIVAVVPGSRADFPSPHPGAIRSMVFSPEPWDLLVWAEDQGRICIGDVRTGLKSKQLIHLEPKEETLRKLVFEDVPSEEPTHLEDLEAELLRRYRNVPENTSAINFATEYIEARRRQRQQRQELANARSQTSTPAVRYTPEGDDAQGLTAREQQILETLRTSRQREEARAGGQIPRSVNYTTPDMFTNNRVSASSPTSNGGESGRPISEILSSVQESFPELTRRHAAASPRPSSSHATESNGLPPLHAIQDGIWGSSARSGIPRIGETSRLPRRRQSVVLNPPISNSGSSSSSSNGNAANRTAVPSNATAAEEDENPWRIIEEQMSVARGPLFEGAARAQAGSPVPATSDEVTLQQELDMQRRIALAQSRTQREQRDRWRSSRGEGEALTMAQARRLANFPEGYEALRMRGMTRGFGAPREIGGVRTAGLAMSADGGMLWAACEAGIFEIQMRRKGRMFCAALEPR